MYKKLLILCLAMVLFFLSSRAQVKIGDNPTSLNENSVLELESTNKGLVFPRVSLSDIASPSPMTGSVLPGTVVYNTNVMTTGGSGLGLYMWDGSQWTAVHPSSSSGSGWSLTGNSSTNPLANYLGTNDMTGLSLRTNSLEALHIDSLQNVSIGTTGSDNKFEALGKFRLHNGNFNVMYSPDVLPGFFPGIEFAGTHYNNSDTEFLFNGIVNLPSGLGGEPLATITGLLNPSSQINSFLSISRSNMSLNSQGGNGGSGLNISKDYGLYIYSNDNSISSNPNSSFNMTNTGVNLNYYTNTPNGYTNTNMNVNPTSINLNANEQTTATGKYGSINLGTTSYNVSINGQDTGTNMGIDNNGIYFNRFINTVGNSSMNFSDTVITQNINSNVSSKTTGIYIQPGAYGINVSNNNGLNNNTNFNESGYYVNLSNSYNQLYNFQNSNPESYHLELRDDNNSKKSYLDMYPTGYSLIAEDYMQSNSSSSINSSPGNISITNSAGNGDGSALYTTPQYFNLRFYENATQKNTDLTANALGMHYTVNNTFDNKISSLNFDNNFSVQSTDLTTNTNSSISLNPNNLFWSTNNQASSNNTSINMQENLLSLNAYTSTSNSSLTMTGSEALLSGSNFKMGIQTSNPQATVDANGTFKLGEQGTVNKMMANFSYNAGSIFIDSAAHSPTTITPYNMDIIITIPSGNRPSTTQAVVYVSPGSDLPDGVSIAWAKVVSSDTVKVHLINNSTIPQSYAGDFYVSITEF